MTDLETYNIPSRRVALSKTERLNNLPAVQSLSQRSSSRYHHWCASLKNKRFTDFTRLKHLHNQCVELNQILSSEIETYQTVTSPLPVDTLSELDARIQRLMLVVSAQMQMVEQSQELAADLHEIVVELLYQPHIAMSKLMHIARQAELNVRDATFISQIMPIPGLQFDQIIPTRLWPLETDIYAKAIRCANLAAWTAHKSELFVERPEEIIAAALLQDCGILLKINGLQKEGAEVDSDKLQPLQDHPLWSAALSQLLSPASTQLRTMIAQHHERLDGNGYPRKLSQQKITFGSRLLALINRFVELCDCNSTGIDDPHFALESACYPAAEKLFREAELGEWDLGMSSAVLNSLHLSPHNNNFINNSRPFSWKHDQAQTSLGGPHWGSSELLHGGSSAVNNRVIKNQSY